jgi:hypothetical protein
LLRLLPLCCIARDGQFAARLHSVAVQRLTSLFSGPAFYIFSRMLPCGSG